ncbi:histidine kinase [Natrinema salaciae]|uniref:Histidine kinase n=1 Tax=Natrinema salaciae TaxID=1186196 RepID=A0A1H9P6T9_9EURY|nr:histidine kinase [Natrinema salaciae]SER43807.1 hypothetical protein SAMN04489841_3878 [Natrinema salaciae]
MSSKTVAPADVVSGQKVEVTSKKEWLGGVIGGLVGGVAMGLLMLSGMPDAMEMAIPALFGQEGVVAGWGIHLFNSVLFGLVFVTLLTRPRIRGHVENRWRVLGASLFYGAVLWIVAAGVVMPVWLNVIGFAGAPPLPNLALPSLIAHLAYGLVLGGTYLVLRR